MFQALYYCPYADKIIQLDVSIDEEDDFIVEKAHISWPNGVLFAIDGEIFFSVFIEPKNMEKRLIKCLEEAYEIELEEENEESIEDTR